MVSLPFYGGGPGRGSLSPSTGEMPFRAERVFQKEYNGTYVPSAHTQS